MFERVKNKITTARHMLSTVRIKPADILLVPFWFGVCGCVYYVAIVNSIYQHRQNMRE